MKRVRHLEVVHNWPDFSLQRFICHFTTAQIYLVPYQNDGDLRRGQHRKGNMYEGAHNGH